MSKRINLSDTHSLAVNESIQIRKEIFDLKNKETGETDCTGTYTRCFKFARDFKKKI